jgi:hypothetical protein
MTPTLPLERPGSQLAPIAARKEAAAMEVTRPLAGTVVMDMIESFELWQ